MTLRHSLDRQGGRRAEASVSPNADGPLHAAALVHQAVFIEFATIDAAVTAAQPAVNTSDAGLALADAAAAGFVQVYFHGCSICSVWRICHLAHAWPCFANVYVKTVLPQSETLAAQGLGVLGGRGSGRFQFGRDKGYASHATIPAKHKH
jgi:hypothetical protein